MDKLADIAKIVLVALVCPLALPLILDDMEAPNGSIEELPVLRGKSRSV